MRRGLLALIALATALGAAWALLGAAGASPGAAGASSAEAQRCADPYPATRGPANPLMLPRSPGPNPLAGARFFVDGPAHGAAAGAIVRLLGRDPSSYPDDYSWARLQGDLERGPLHAKLARSPRLAHQVALLEKIASEPEAQRFSLYSAGGGPGAVFGQVQKVFCRNLTADPGAVPIITTYFLYQAGYCETYAEIVAHRGTFERQVDEMAAGIGRRPAVMLLELDAIGSSECMAGSRALGAWEADLRYEISKVSALPHTVVYVEGGYADAAGPAYTARVLRAVGVRRIRGFFTNDTHLDWTSNEIRWGERVSRLTGGAHFVVNTADNGRGPKLNPHPFRQGIEQLCNPPGRGLGPRPTTFTGFRHVDAFLWVHPPGNSSGTCHGGPPAGSFWVHRALVEAAHANGRLGPGYASDPY